MKKICMLIITVLIIYSCKDEKGAKNKIKIEKIGMCKFEFPSDYSINYLSEDSARGNIIFKNEVIAEITIGYLDKKALTHQNGDVIKKSTLSKYKINMVYNKELGNDVTLTTFISDTTNETSFFGDKRINTIVIASKPSNKEDTKKFEGILKTLKPI